MINILKLIVVGLLLVNIASAERIKMFELKKHQIISKVKDKIEMYQVGDVIIKTDLTYNESKQHYTGSRLDIDIPKGIDKGTFMISMWRGGSKESIYFLDDFGESITYDFHSYNFIFNGENLSRNSSGKRIFKFAFDSKEMKVYINNSFIGKQSLEHMGKITRFEQQLTLNDQHINNFIVIAD